MSSGTLPCLDSSRNSDSLSVSDSLCKVICEIGGGIFVEVCRTERSHGAEPAFGLDERRLKVGLLGKRFVSNIF